MYRRYFWLVGVLTATLLSCMCFASSKIETVSPLTSVGSQNAETSLGDLVADSVRASASVPIAFVAAGTLREVTISKGAADSSAVSQCIQYPDDKIVILELKGSEIRQAIERSLSVYPQKNLGFLQISGLRIIANAAASKGSRITTISLDSGAFSDESKYTVATTYPVATGAYGYFTIWDKGNVAKGKDLSISEALNKFLASKTSLDYSQANRIVFKK